MAESSLSARFAQLALQEQQHQREGERLRHERERLLQEQELEDAIAIANDYFEAHDDELAVLQEMVLNLTE